MTAKKPRTKRPAKPVGEPLFSEPRAVPIGELVPDPANARKHDEANLAAITASLKRFGQYRDALVNSRNNQVVVGNGMMAAATALGWETLRCRFADLSPEQQTALSIVDNRSAEMAEWDLPLLEAQLREWDQAGEEADLLAALQFEQLMNTVADLPDEPASDPSAREPVTCPKCGCQFQPE